MNETILTVEDIHLYFGSVEALEEVSFEVRKGEIFAIYRTRQRWQDLYLELH